MRLTLEGGYVNVRTVLISARRDSRLVIFHKRTANEEASRDDVDTESLRNISESDEQREKWRFKHEATLYSTIIRHLTRVTDQTNEFRVSRAM